MRWERRIGITEDEDIKNPGAGKFIAHETVNLSQINMVIRQTLSLELKERCRIVKERSITQKVRHEVDRRRSWGHRDIISPEEDLIMGPLIRQNEYMCEVLKAAIAGSNAKLTGVFEGTITRPFNSRHQATEFLIKDIIELDLRYYILLALSSADREIVQEHLDNPHAVQEKLTALPLEADKVEFYVGSLYARELATIANGNGPERLIGNGGTGGRSY